MRTFAILFILFFAASNLYAQAFAGEAEIAEGETEFGGYVEFTYFNNRSIAWTGSEASFKPRVKADIVHAIYDDVIIRVKGEWTPSVNNNSINYTGLKKKEGYPEDAYILFNNLRGRGIELRLGVVKVPFGHFDTFAYDDENRPMSFSRTREWDYGMRLDASFKLLDISIAVIDGDGRDGTDANSAKSAAMRLAFPSIKSGAYPETLESTKYPNPKSANPDGGFKWRLGLSAYAGNKYSTPIKVKNNHYGADLKVDLRFISMKAQYTYMEGGFTDPAEASQDLSGYGYSDAVTGTTDTFPKGNAIVVEVTAGVTPKTMVTVMAERYEPDSESDGTDRQKLRTRFVFGIRYEMRPKISAAFFFTQNNNPYFDSISAINTGRGDNVLQMGIAADF
ncbi:MAG: hypothetical protein V3S46_04180 [Nitrospinota bacterium]